MSLASYSFAPLLIPSMFSSGRLFDNDDFFNTKLPQSNIEQTDTAVNVELAVPGFREDEVDVRLDGNLLKIQAQHSGKGERDYMDSRGKVTGRSKWSSSSNVYESFRLPSGLNLSGLQKTVDNGMLKVSIPKLAITERPQQQQPPQQSEGQQLRQQPQQQQLQWPPRVDTQDAGDGKHITYTIALPGINRNDVRINIDNGNLYLTLFEHGAGHAFDTCKTCSTNQQQQKRSHDYDEQQRSRDINAQCNQFNERSCVIRLPFGTTSDGVDAKFENEQLIVKVEKKGQWGSVPIH